MVEFTRVRVLAGVQPAKISPCKSVDLQGLFIFYAAPDVEMIKKESYN